MHITSSHNHIALTGVMTGVLEERSCLSFDLERLKLPKDAVLRFYTPDKGEFFFGKLGNAIELMALYEDGILWMNDDPSELAELTVPLEHAHGRVLTSGLGIGLFPYLVSLLCYSRVTQIDIVECNQQIIDLVYPQLNLMLPSRMMCDDIHSYLRTTQVRYDFIYIDIWNDFMSPIVDADEVTQLARGCLLPGGEVRIWLQELSDRVKPLLPTKSDIERIFSISGSLPFTNVPCMICAKPYRSDYAGLCVDCADTLKISEPFHGR